MIRFVSATVLLILFFSASAIAQEEEPENTHKFRRDNIFIGGSINLGFGSGFFSGGANPEVGYTIAEWLDAGISTNFIYNTISADYNGGLRQRSLNYGGGIFVRAYPFRGFFLQVLPEYNRINTKLKDVYGNGDEYRVKQEAPSLLLGVGYGSRIVGQSNFFTVLMFDAGNNINSPYISYSGSKQPILRAGFNVYLRPKRR